MRYLLHRPRIGLLPVFILLVFASTTHPAETSSPSIERMKKDLSFLASDVCEGRGPETVGINKAADYIATAFKGIGLRPALPDGSYFQNFSIPGTARLGSPNQLALEGPLGQRLELTPGKQFAVCGLTASGKASAGVVFAGYGITAKPGKDDEGPEYDDYAGLDVKGKVVIVLRKTPRFSSKVPFAPDAERRYAPLVTKIANAEQHKAAALLFVNDHETAAKSDDLMPFDYAAGGGRAEFPVLHVRRALVDQMLQTSARTTLAELETDIDRDLKPRSVELTGWSAQLCATVDRPEVKVKNILGVLDGKGPLAKEYVVIGAHYDHLGRGDPGSLAGGSKAIHYGADDNGSGTTAVLELARRFAAQPEREGRSLVFMLFTGEERGLLGSVYYCKNPVLPLKDTAAMINLDMVGRLRADEKTKKDKLEIGGVGTAKTFEPLLDKLNASYNFDLKKTRSGEGPSDHTSFYRKEVPVFFFFTGMHAQYHRPTDTPDLVNYEGMKKVVDMVEELTADLAAEKERPVWQKTASSGMTPGRAGVPTIRFMPGEYDEDETRGVPVGGVMEGGPADKAGLKKGDWIVEVGGVPVKNMGGYMKAMGAQKGGEPVEMVVMRDGKKITLKVTPDAPGSRGRGKE
jgi:Zn-dependent M28 family amino/carboxypeptidase